MDALDERFLVYTVIACICSVLGALGGVGELLRGDTPESEADDTKPKRKPARGKDQAAPPTPPPAQQAAPAYKPDVKKWVGPPYYDPAKAPGGRPPRS